MHNTFGLPDVHIKSNTIDWYIFNETSNIESFQINCLLNVWLYGVAYGLTGGVNIIGSRCISHAFKLVCIGTITPCRAGPDVYNRHLPHPPCRRNDPDDLWRNDHYAVRADYKRIPLYRMLSFILHIISLLPSRFPYFQSFSLNSLRIVLRISSDIVCVTYLVWHSLCDVSRLT